MIITNINPARAIVPMLGRHLKWLNVGQSFLTHAADLIAIKLAPRCRTCGGEGRAVPLLEKGKVDVSCKCRHGVVMVERDGKPVDLDVPPLLMSLGWELCCTDCGRPARGENDQTSTRFTVECDCTTRVFQMAVH